MMALLCTRGPRPGSFVERELAKGHLALVCSEINQSLVLAAKSKKQIFFEPDLM